MQLIQRIKSNDGTAFKKRRSISQQGVNYNASFNFNNSAIILDRMMLDDHNEIESKFQSTH